MSKRYKDQLLRYESMDYYDYDDDEESAMEELDVDDDDDEDVVMEKDTAPIVDTGPNEAAADPAGEDKGGEEEKDANEKEDGVDEEDEDGNEEAAAAAPPPPSTMVSLEDLLFHHLRPAKVKRNKRKPQQQQSTLDDTCETRLPYFHMDSDFNKASRELLLTLPDTPRRPLPNVVGENENENGNQGGSGDGDPLTMKDDWTVHYKSMETVLPPNHGANEGHRRCVSCPPNVLQNAHHNNNDDEDDDDYRSTMEWTPRHVLDSLMRFYNLLLRMDSPFLAPAITSPPVCSMEFDVVSSSSSHNNDQDQAVVKVLWSIDLNRDELWRPTEWMDDLESRRDGGGDNSDNDDDDDDDRDWFAVSVLPVVVVDRPLPNQEQLQQLAEDIQNLLQSSNEYSIGITSSASPRIQSILKAFRQLSLQVVALAPEIHTLLEQALFPTEDESLTKGEPAIAKEEAPVLAEDASEQKATETQAESPYKTPPPTTLQKKRAPPTTTSLLRSILGKISTPIHPMVCTKTLHAKNVYQSSEALRIARTSQKCNQDLWGSARTQPLAQCFETPPPPDGAGDEPVISDRCIFCFEELNDYNVGVQVLTCGHAGCQNCWRGFLMSSASSGEGSLGCPGFMCPAILQLHDVASILATRKDNGSCDGTAEMDSELFGRLVPFHIAHNALLYLGSPNDETTAAVVRHCSTPSCGRLFLHHDDAPSNTTICCLCTCGATYCATCDEASPSHVGLSCSRYARLKQSLDKISGEVKNMEYMKSRTRPCPQCRFPIEKNGGCNHIWCEKCNHYFCWVCGGSGYVCDSYECFGDDFEWFKKRKFKGDDDDDDDGGDEEDGEASMSALVRNYKYYSAAESKLRDLRMQWSKEESFKTEEEKAALATETQIQQVLVWLYSVALLDSAERKASVAQEEEDEYFRALRQGIQRMELVIHARKIRKVAALLGQSVEQVVSNRASLQDSLRRVDRGEKANSSTKRALTPRQVQKLQRLAQRRNQGGVSTLSSSFEEVQEGGGGGDTFQSMMMDQDLEELCRATEEELATLTWKAMLRSVRDLTKSAAAKTGGDDDDDDDDSGLASKARRRRRSRKGPQPDVVPLNERLPREERGWQASQEDGGGKKKREARTEEDGAVVLRWKPGKGRTKAKRQSALGRRQD